MAMAMATLLTYPRVAAHADREADKGKDCYAPSGVGIA
jgi:hypothetical protein